MCPYCPYGAPTPQVYTLVCPCCPYSFGLGLGLRLFSESVSSQVLQRITLNLRFEIRVTLGTVFLSSEIRAKLKRTVQI